MGQTTGIEWTDATWNPWRGCTKVSPGCKNCYMFREQRRYGRDPSVVVRASPATFNAPLRWKDPRRVFTCSWSDFFHEDADEWRDEAWRTIEATPHLTYQILTKRPERIRDWLPLDWEAGHPNGYPNVWLGTSVENQHLADRRIPILAEINCRVKFLSCEPLLGPIDLWSVPESRIPRTTPPRWWVIAGGESGPNARGMELDWVRLLRDRCQGDDDHLRIPFFFKQWGGPCEK